VGTSRKIESSERLCWPQHGFEIARGVSIVPDFDGLPGPVQRKLNYLIERGVVRVLDADDQSPTVIESREVTPFGTTTSDAPAESVPAVDMPAVDVRRYPSSDVSLASDGAPLPEPINLEKTLELARELGEFGTALANPIRAAIVIVLADGRALAPSELARLLLKPRQTVSRHALVLERAGLLSSERNGGARRYHLHIRAADRVARLLAGS
jgi:DNA-binding transcriptional ArsR family regulator